MRRAVSLNATCPSAARCWSWPGLVETWQSCQGFACGPRAGAVVNSGGLDGVEAVGSCRWFEFRPSLTILLTMVMPASTPVPISEAKTHLSDLARRVRLQHERITLTRNGEPEAVLMSVDDLEGLEMTLEILGDSDAVVRISESLAALGRGEYGVDLATVRADLARRRHRGT
jgi:antitoxin YefM